MRLEPSKVAEHLEETWPLSQEVTGLTACFCSLKYTRSLLGRESSPKTKEWTWLPHTTFLERGLSKHTPVLGELVFTFPHMPYPLWSVGGKAADQSTNPDRAELLKYFWKPSRQPILLHPTPPILTCPLLPGLQNTGREHVLRIFSSSPRDNPWHSSLGQISAECSAGSSTHFSALDKLCKFDQQGHSQSLGGWAVILLHPTTALPPQLVYKPMPWGIFCVKEERTRLSGSLYIQCSRL